MGKKETTREEVMQALKEAQCEDIIAKLPDGIDTVIGSSGTYVSGGEAQRLSIARAMLKNAPILILMKQQPLQTRIMKQRCRKRFPDCLRARP